jgi:polysaccharide biosynthesis protein PslG
MHARLRRALSRPVLPALLAILLALIGLVALRRDAIQYTLAHWTGEEEIVEQLKGTAALVVLRLTQPPPETDPLAPIAHAGVSPYGVNTFLEQEPDIAKVDHSLAMIAEAGFTWIRQQFPWEDIEIAGKGDYWDHKWNVSAWAKYDRIVDLAEKHGLQIIARLDNPPAWSRSVGDAEGWTLAPPDDPADYGDFVYAVVSRYRGRIRHYQIWNEPNIYPEWGDQPADPAGYTELLKVAYRRAEEADPDCVIISAALAQTTEETPPEFGPRNMSDLLYLEGMYAAGAKDHFDIMGAMVYGLWTGPYDLRTSRDRANFARVQLLREIMVRHGDSGKPIWAAEVGWNALPEGFAGAPLYGRVTPEQQARYAAEAYQRAAREWPWMGVMNYWFFRRPSDAERDQAWYYFRMVEPDFAALPVYDALADLAQQPRVMYTGFHQEDHPALRYDGGWKRIDDAAAVLGAYARGAVGATLEVPFDGNRLALVLHGAERRGRIEVEVDGQPAQAERVWEEPHTGAMAVTVAWPQGGGPHLATVRVAEGMLDLDGVIVWRQRAAWGPWILVGAGVLVAGWALARATRFIRRGRHG